MKIKQFFLLAAFGLTATATFTSCEDILGHWEKPTPVTPTPTPTPTPEEVIYSFSLRNLADDADVTATALTVTDQTGTEIATATSDGKYTIKQDDLGSATMLWLEATTATGKYIAKANIDELPAIAEAGKLKMATLGDLMNSDGTFSAAAEDGKTPVGAIAYLGNDATTEAIADGGGHGLVLCLKNAAEGAAAQWSSVTDVFEFGEDAKVTDANGLKRTTNVSGYTNTKTLAEKDDAVNKYKAAYNAYNYTALTAPAGTTGWFLPSAQQWVRMMTGLGGLAEDDIVWGSWFNNDHSAATVWETALAKAGAGNYDSMTSAYQWYWSSSEYSANYAVGLLVDATVTGGAYGFYWPAFVQSSLFNYLSI